MNIVKFLDVDVRTIHEHFSWSFGIPMETPVIEASDKEEDDVESSQSLMLKSKTASMRRTKTSDLEGMMERRSSSTWRGRRSRRILAMIKTY